MVKTKRTSRLRLTCYLTTHKMSYLLGDQRKQANIAIDIISEAICKFFIEQMMIYRNQKMVGD